MKDYIGNKFLSGILVKQIKEYWAQRGQQIDVWVEPLGTNPSAWQVRSNIKFEPFGRVETDDEVK